MTDPLLSVADLAAQLGVDPRTVRAFLRREFPRSTVELGSRWILTPAMVRAATDRFSTRTTNHENPSTPPRSNARTLSDEHYVIDLCDDILGMAALRQHSFDWLRGDPDTRGRSVALPVDAYYPELQLVVEYHERQHQQEVPHFDKPGKLTVSGVDRGEQRRIYDDRRRDVIPGHGLRLVIIAWSDLDSTSNGTLRRSRDSDRVAIERLLRDGNHQSTDAAVGRVR